MSTSISEYFHSYYYDITTGNGHILSKNTFPFFVNEIFWRVYAVPLEAFDTPNRFVFYSIINPLSTLHRKENKMESNTIRRIRVGALITQFPNFSPKEDVVPIVKFSRFKYLFSKDDYSESFYGYNLSDNSYYIDFRGYLALHQ